MSLEHACTHCRLSVQVGRYSQPYEPLRVAVLYVGKCAVVCTGNEVKNLELFAYLLWAT
jgi:hypothetical protein